MLRTFMATFLLVSGAILSAGSVALAAHDPIRGAPRQAFPRTAGGDIPDTATYLRYKGRVYSIEYVEGWVQVELAHNGVRMSDIDSFERVSVAARPSKSLLEFVRGSGLRATEREYRGAKSVSITSIHLPAGWSVRLTFRAPSAPDPVTGKRVTLVIDRYFVPGRRNIAIISFATPLGVDNVDAFRRIARSFRWLRA